MKAEGKGHAELHCRYHVQFKARHGSHWCSTYKATELKPYIDAAWCWIAENLEDRYVHLSFANLNGLLQNGWAPIPAFRLKGRNAKERAYVAFARLREAGIPVERLLAVHLGVNALIGDDRGSHRVQEFRIVQVAKALHRLASGYHSEWKKDYEGRNPLNLKFDFYPKSSGIVLREIGAAVEHACAFVTDKAVPDIISKKHIMSGPHVSHLPGWKPLWQRMREGSA